MDNPTEGKNWYSFVLVVLHKNAIADGDLDRKSLPEMFCEIWTWKYKGRDKPELIAFFAVIHHEDYDNRTKKLFEDNPFLIKGCQLDLSRKRVSRSEGGGGWRHLHVLR